MTMDYSGISNLILRRVNKELLAVHPHLQLLNLASWQ